MVGEVLRGLGLVDGGAGKGDGGAAGSGRRVVMDCTVGRGGHAVRIVEAMGRRGEGGVLIALDVDPENLKYARKRLEAAMAGVAGNGGATDAGGKIELRTFHANFGEAADVLDAMGLDGVDALLADFGVSTNQLLESKHGLSFREMSPWTCGLIHGSKRKRRIFWRNGTKKNWPRLCRSMHKNASHGASRGKLFRRAQLNRYLPPGTLHVWCGRWCPASGARSTRRRERFKHCGWQ